MTLWWLKGTRWRWGVNFPRCLENRTPLAESFCQRHVFAPEKYYFYYSLLSNSNIDGIMSLQKGNVGRSRPQKYQNNHKFKNNLHDTSHKTKFINNIQVVNVCERCKKIIEWKIKYKKYKPLKAPAKCTKCEQKVIKHAYHIICGPCALCDKVCPKCGEKGDVVQDEVKEEPIALDRELRLMLKKLPERKRRTFLRYMNRKAAGKEKSAKSETDNNTEVVQEDESSESEGEASKEKEPLTRDDLLEKLKSLMVSKKNKDDGDDFGSDLDDFDDTDDDDDDD